MSRALGRRYGHAGLRNAEGMTWLEWSRAANIGTGGRVPSGDLRSGLSHFRAQRQGWEEGEDPTDWAAYYSRRSA